MFLRCFSQAIKKAQKPDIIQTIINKGLKKKVKSKNKCPKKQVTKANLGVWIKPLNQIKKKKKGNCKFRSNNRKRRGKDKYDKMGQRAIKLAILIILKLKIRDELTLANDSMELLIGNINGRTIGN